MPNPILIAYASAYGSTIEVAAAIGETLGTRGFRVDVRPIKDRPALDGYQSVLIGSAVQYGQWLPEAVDFVKTNREALQRVPVALFCVHIQNTGDNDKERQSRQAYLDTVRGLLTPLAPVAEGYFAGRFDRRGAQQMIPGFFARLVPPLDFRNWNKIRAWAAEMPLSVRV